jgi:uncharacterized YccA/Bax inhibitor family protein
MREVVIDLLFAGANIAWWMHSGASISILAAGFCIGMAVHAFINEV